MSPETMLSMEESQRRIDKLVRDLEPVAGWADRDERDMALQAFIGCWDELDPDDARWGAVNSILTIHAPDALVDTVLAIERVVRLTAEGDATRGLRRLEQVVRAHAE